MLLAVCARKCSNLSSGITGSTDNRKSNASFRSITSSSIVTRMLGQGIDGSGSISDDDTNHNIGPR